MNTLNLAYPALDELLRVEKGEAALSTFALDLYFRAGNDDDTDVWHDASAALTLQISIRYLDLGTDPIQVGYSHDASSETVETMVTKGNTGKWKWKHYTMAATARLAHSVYENFAQADIRLTCASELILSAVTLRETTLDAEIVLRVSDESTTAGAGDALSVGTHVGGWTIGETMLSADSGALVLDAQTPALRMGSASAFGTGVGIWEGKESGVYKWRVGDPSGQYVSWNGSQLYVSGVIAGTVVAGGTDSNSWTINQDLTDANVDLVLKRTTGGSATMRWNGTIVSLDKDFYASGKIGIGKSAPSSLLHLYASNADAAIEADNSGTSHGSLSFKASTSGHYIGASASIGKISFYTLDSVPAWNEVASIEVVNSTAAGRYNPPTDIIFKVAPEFGTPTETIRFTRMWTSDGGQVRVTSNDTVGTAFTLANTDTGGHIWNFLSTGSAALGGAGLFSFYDATVSGVAGYRFAITGTGSVGISTTTPRKQLDVLSTTQAQLRLTYTDNSVYTDFTTDSGGNLTIAPTGDLILNPAGKDIFPNANYDLNLGGVNKKYLSLHAAELRVETLVAQNTLATIGGRILILPTNILIADASAGATSIDVKYNNLASGDVIYLEVGGSVEFMSVTSGASAITGGYRYNVTRNLDGSGADAWYAGDAVANTGQTGSGFMDLYSVRGVKSASEAGPTIVGNIRNSSTYNDWSSNWAIGNLNGLYGYGVTTYGAAFGKYAANIPNLTVDATNGIRMRYYTTTIGQWDTSGNLTLGEVAASKANIVFISGNIALRTNTTENLVLMNTGALTVGEVGASKSNIYIASGSIQLRTNTTASITLDTAGKIAVANLLSVGTATFGSSGLQLDYNGGTPRFYAGDGANKYLKFDGTNIAWKAANTELDTSGNLTVTTGATITGSTLRTAASGARVLMDTTGLYGYDGSGNGVFALPTSSITWNGESISAGTVIIGNSTTGNGNIEIAGSTISFRSGTTGYLTLDDSTFSMTQGLFALGTAGTVTLGSGNIDLDDGLAGFMRYSRLVISSSSGAFTIRGIATPSYSGMILLLRNNSGNTMTIKDNGTPAAGFSKISTLAGDEVSTGNAMAAFEYDAASNRWYMFSWRA